MTAVGSTPPGGGAGQPLVPPPFGPANTPWAPVPAGKRNQWLSPVGVGVATLAATAYTAILNPNTSHAFPLCPLKYFTGYDCPLCGSLRAVHSLTHGDLIGAADHNVMFVAATPFIVYAYAAWLLRSLGLNVPQLTNPPRVMTAIIVLLVVFGVARNLTFLPGYTFMNSTAHLAGRSN